MMPAVLPDTHPSIKSIKCCLSYEILWNQVYKTPHGPRHIRGEWSVRDLKLLLRILTTINNHLLPRYKTVEIISSCIATTILTAGI